MHSGMMGMESSARSAVSPQGPADSDSRFEPGQTLACDTHAFVIITEPKVSRGTPRARRSRFNV